jgi:hypothetical protein
MSDSWVVAGILFSQEPTHLITSRTGNSPASTSIGIRRKAVVIKKGLLLNHRGQCPIWQLCWHSGGCFPDEEQRSSNHQPG